MLEIDEQFTSLRDWLAYAEDNPRLFDRALADSIGYRIAAGGLVEPLTGRIFSSAHVATGNWREELIADGLNSRARAVLKVIAEILGDRRADQIDLYATEAVTAFSHLLRAKFPRLTLSEYVPEGDPEGRFQHQDLMGLTFPADSFDIVTTNDVLEHVPDLDQGLREIARVLKPGGWHVGTHPFRFMSPDSDLRAQMIFGQVVNRKPPEWHGNPLDLDGPGSLVFETPGWDIIERCITAGFSHAEMRFVASERHGVLTENLGVFVTCLRK